MSELNRHEDITKHDCIKQTEFQKHAPLLKSWKIEYIYRDVESSVAGFCTHLSGKSLKA